MTILMVDYHRNPLLQPGWGQEEFTAMSNPITWPKRTRVEIVMDMPLNCCKPRFELHVTGITTAGTTQTNGGEALQEAVQVQQ